MFLYEKFCESMVGKFITIQDIDGKMHQGFVVSMKSNFRPEGSFALTLEDDIIEKIVVDLEAKTK